MGDGRTRRSARRPAARRALLPHVGLSAIYNRYRGDDRRIDRRQGGQRRQVMDRTGVAAHPARRIRQDRHGAGTGARDEQLLLLDQPLRRSAARGCDRRHPDAAHHSAKRHRFGHRAGCIPLRPLPRRTQQVALHPDSAHRCALHRFVPADAHDAAGAADPDLRGVGGDDERPMAFAHRLPRLAGALGHRPLVVHGTHRPRHRWTSTAAC